jgi:hypothetical protein
MQQLVLILLHVVQQYSELYEIIMFRAIKKKNLPQNVPQTCDYCSSH